MSECKCGGRFFPGAPVRVRHTASRWSKVISVEHTKMFCQVTFNCLCGGCCEENPEGLTQTDSSEVLDTKGGVQMELWEGVGT